jgi:hypothetical protein
MPIPEEYSQRRMTSELMCWTEKARKQLGPLKLHEVLTVLASEHHDVAAKRLSALTPDQRRTAFRNDWAKWLGVIEPVMNPKLIEGKAEDVPGGKLSRMALEVEPGIVVPLILITSKDAKGKSPVVVMIAQAGKAALLKERGESIAAFLKAGVAVCLVDLRGTGETQAGTSAERGSSRTSIAQTNLILGQPVLGSQLRDLRTVIRWLGTRNELDGNNVAVWADSFARMNPKEFQSAVPLDAPDFPAIGEPGAGILAELVGLYEEAVRAITIRGGLVSYASIHNEAYAYIPFDVVAFGTRGSGPFAPWELFGLRDVLPPTEWGGSIGTLNELFGQPASDPKESAAWAIEKLKAK